MATQTEDTMKEVIADKDGDRSVSEFDTAQLPVEHVVVYTDRAEVCRNITVTVKKGEHEVILKKLSPCVDEESIRYMWLLQSTIRHVDVVKSVYYNYMYIRWGL